MKIEKLSVSDIVSEVADRWHQQYYRNFGRSYLAGGGDPEDIYQAILSASSVAEINDAIGNDSWTTVQCDYCGKKVDSVFIFGNDDASIYACRPCILSAINE